MKNTVVMQECQECGKRFPVTYCEDGTIKYISDTCDCESGFTPIEGQPSISEWLEIIRENKDKWFCTDPDSFQHCKEHENGKYSFVEIVWLDTVEGDPGYPDKEYTVKSAYVDLDDYNEKEREIAISGYYDSLDAVYTEYEDAAEQIIAECIFEEMTEGSATTYGMMTKEEAEKFVKKYIEEH